MTRFRRNLLGEWGLRCISSSLVVADVPALPRRRASIWVPSRSQQTLSHFIYESEYLGLGYILHLGQKGLHITR